MMAGQAIYESHSEENVNESIYNITGQLVWDVNITRHIENNLTTQVYNISQINSIRIQIPYDRATLILGAAMSHLFFRKMGFQDSDLVEFQERVMRNVNINDLNKIIFGDDYVLRKFKY